MLSTTKRITLAMTAMGVLTGCSADVSFVSTLRNVQKNQDCSENCGNIRTINESYDVPGTSPKVDVLFIVDASPRMFKTVTKLQDRLQSFFTRLVGGANFHAGVVNSSLHAWDIQAARYPKASLMPLNPYPTELENPLYIVTGGVRNADWIMGRNLNFDGLSLVRDQNTPGQEFCEAQPYCTMSGATQPLNVLKQFIANRNSGTNAGFIRSDAVLVPVIISAGDENDPANGDPAAPIETPASVIAAYNASVGNAATGLRAYSIIVKPGDATCLAQYSSIFQMGSGGTYGTQLDQFAKQTGGASISLCDADYGPGLSAITSGFSSNIKTLTLKERPIEGSVKIVAVPAADLRFSVTDKTVTFEQALPAGAKISISYQVKLE